MSGKSFFIADNMCTPYKLLLNRTGNYLVANGWESVDDSKEADAVMIGTCAAFYSLEDETLELCHDHFHDKAEKIVFGCLPKISPDKTKALKADTIIPSHLWERVERLVENPTVPLQDVPATHSFRNTDDYRRYDEGKQFVLVNTGCKSNCPFCPHKMGIGEMKSIDPETIVKQVKHLTENDVHTIVLTGNDTGSYGQDIGTSLPELVRQVLPHAPTLHLCQINPVWVHKYRDEFLEILQDPKIKDFQVLIQSSSDRVLNMMEREPVVGELESFFKELRETRPDLLTRTDVMIGYPTSTDEEEEATLEYAANYFDEIIIYAFEIFPYSRIAKMDLPFYDQETIDKRTERALHYLMRFPNKLIHRGGQIYETMEAMEVPKEELRVTKDVA